MSLTTPQDILITITVPNDDKTLPPTIRTERRITPTWTIQHLKLKLEPITGIPSTSQSLRTYNDLSSDPNISIPLTNDTDTLTNPIYHLRKNSLIEVLDTRPLSARINLTDVSNVEKYEMPVDQYEKLDDTVLAWKKRQGLGRFEQNAKTPQERMEERRSLDWKLVSDKKVGVGKRCRVGGGNERRGVVQFVGEIDGLGGEKERGCVWVGVELDEPVGRNDGSVKVEVESEDGKKTMEMRRVFECRDKFGVFARPEKVEIGDFPPLNDLDEDMEEL